MIAFALGLALATALYFYFTRTFDYWQKRGVKHDKPWPFVGNRIKEFLGLINGMDFCTEVYRKHPSEKIVGMFNCSRPELLIRDLALANRVLTDSIHFHRRYGAVPKDYKIEPLQKISLVLMMTCGGC